MKYITVLTVLLAAFTVKADVAVDPIEVVYGSSLEKLYSNHDFMDNVEYGDVKVNKTEKTVTMTLQHIFVCPDEMFCIQVMPAPTVITLPLVKTFVDGCGSEVFIALVDKTPVDGLREKIVVTDNTKNTCPTFVALEETDVQYSTFNPWVSDTTYSAFKGSALRLLPTYFQ